MYKKIRIDYFDIAKGIAILAVILGHCGGLPQKVIDFIFSFHMPVFFLTSGYFLKLRDSKENVILKAKQLLLPYCFTGLAIIVCSTIWMVVKGYFIDDIYVNIINRCWAVFYGSGQEYQTPVYVPNAQALWFFPALFFALVIVHECVKRRYSAIYIAIFALIGYYTSKIFWIPLSLQAGMVSSVYVYIGYEMKRHNMIEDLGKRIVAVEILAVYILYYIWGGGRLYLVRNWLEQGIWEIIGSVCAVLCVIKLSKIISNKIPPCKAVLSFLGRNTQLILCFHIIDLALFDWSFIYNKFAGYGNVVLFSILFALRSVWAVGGMLVCKGIKNLWKQKLQGQPVKKGQINQEFVRRNQLRNVHIDVARGITIILMVYGHYTIDAQLSTVIFSFHMPIFILISGYFFKKETKLSDTLYKVGKGLLLPYGVASVVYAFISLWHYVSHTDISIVSGSEAIGIFFQKLYYALWGISFTSAKFQNIESVGPIWFIICLAGVRIIYAILRKIFPKDIVLSIVVLCVSILGYFLGKYYAYLPWSLDVGLVSLIFFHTGYLLKQTEWFKRKLNLCLGLFLFLIWILDIHYGGLDLASRKYSFFPLCIVGAVAGSMLVLEVCKSLAQVGVIKDFFSFCGRHAMLILCVHSMEQRTCSWTDILPGQSGNVVFLFRMMIILTFVIIALCLKEGGKRICESGNIRLHKKSAEKVYSNNEKQQYGGKN